MLIKNDIKSRKCGNTAAHGTAITVGKFDGMHIGHRSLMEKLSEYRSERGYEILILSFNPSPSVFFGGGENHPAIFDENEYKQLVIEMGADRQENIIFDEKAANMAPEDFVKDILIDTYNMKAMAVGTDFRFGKDRNGDTSLLAELSAKYDFSFSVVAKAKVEGETVSSSAIREALYAGNIKKANKMLGRNFFFLSEVVHGKGIGGRSLYPTINQKIKDDKICPKHGVYVSRTITARGAFLSVTNIGLNPTFGGLERPVAETHILEESEDLYGSEVRVELLDYLREEQKFSDTESLKAAISHDIIRAKEIWKM